MYLESRLPQPPQQVHWRQSVSATLGGLDRFSATRRPPPSATAARGPTLRGSPPPLSFKDQAWSTNTHNFLPYLPCIITAKYLPERTRSINSFSSLCSPSPSRHRTRAAALYRLFVHSLVSAFIARTVWIGRTSSSVTARNLSCSSAVISSHGGYVSQVDTSQPSLERLSIVEHGHGCDDSIFLLSMFSLTELRCCRGSCRPRYRQWVSFPTLSPTSTMPNISIDIPSQHPRLRALDPGRISPGFSCWALTLTSRQFGHVQGRFRR
jgi:hypothetical protein